MISRRSFLHRVAASLVAFIPAVKELIKADAARAQCPPGYVLCSIQVCYEIDRRCDLALRQWIYTYECFDYYEFDYCSTIQGIGGSCVPMI